MKGGRFTGIGSGGLLARFLMAFVAVLLATASILNSRALEILRSEVAELRAELRATRNTQQEPQLPRQQR